MGRLTIGTSPDIKIYVGDVDQLGTFSSAAECYSGGMHGIVNCSGTGRYIIWWDPTGPGYVRFNEVLAYGSSDLAVDGTVSQTGVGVWANPSS